MEKSERSFADYVAAVFGPVLIMTLVGSLVFFLVEVLYVGQYEQRLLWLFSCFIFGAVLTSRISMQSDIRSRAGLYAVVLAVVMWFALNLFVRYPSGSIGDQFGWLCNLLLILVILWSVHRLTVDSTLDKDKETEGRGLLDAAGLDAKPAAQDDDETDDEDDEAPPSRRRKRQGDPLSAWWKRYQKYREERKERPRAHGVWVVYFSLAALPLFGLGQAVIPASDGARREYTFWLLCMYVASGLGLLLTTTFLGLRRYLRAKRIKMPASLAGTWLTFGGLLIVVLLVIGAMMPRPNPEISPIQKLLQVGSPTQKPSEWAMMDGDNVKGKGKGRKQLDKKGDPQNGKAKGKNAGDKSDNKNGQAKSGKNSKGQSGKKTDKNGSQQKKTSEKKQNADGKSGKKGDKADATKKDEQQDSRNRNEQSSRSSWQWQMPQWLTSWLPLLKWMVMGLIGLLVAFLVLRALIRFLANFTGWAQALLNFFSSFWKNLWKENTGKKQVAKAETRVSFKPFELYRDPFQNGMAEQMSPTELLHYSFDALQAWARENRLERGEDETPLEFSERISRDIPELQQDLANLMKYYNAAAYGPHLLDYQCEDALRGYWLTLMDVAHQPLSKEPVPG